MTAMIASQTKIAGVNPIIMISLGSIVGILAREIQSTSTVIMELAKNKINNFEDHY